MSAKIVLITNPKGGVGKSTLATMLTGWAVHNMELDEFLAVDMGSQLSLFNAVRRLEDPKLNNLVLPLVTDNEDSFINALEGPAETKKLILIDSNSNISKYETAMLLAAADLVLVPVVASGFDLDATLHFVKFLESAKDNGAIVRAVLNRMDITLECHELRDFTRNTLKLTPTTGQVPNKPAYYKRLTVADVPNQDTNDLMAQIKKLLWD